VVDGQLVTSRKPDDIPAFNRELTKLFSQARQRSDSRAGSGPAA
jgi:protease I